MKSIFNRKIISILILTLLLAPAFVSCERSGKKFDLPVRDVVIMKADGTSVTCSAELAVKEEERNHGFMFRKNIPDGTGMLFVFEKSEIKSFWMKNTPHPLSIAYIDKYGEITDILDMTPYSLSSILSSRSVLYALEVPQGWFEKNGIKVKDTVKIPSIPK